MGEYAEAALWAEMNGRDPGDMSPEDWIEYYDEQKPSEPNDIALDARITLDMFKTWLEDDDEVDAGLIVQLFPKLTRGEAVTVLNGLTILAKQYDPELYQGDDDAEV